MKSTIFDGIAERLADIKRSEGRFVPADEPAIEPLYNRAAPIDDPVGYCSVYGHNIGVVGACVRCGLSVKRVTPG